MKANVFICHNPFHLYISSQICKDKFRSDQFENWIISPNLQAVPDVNAHFLLAKNDLVGKIRTSWIIKKTVQRLAKTYGDRLSIFLPHIDGIIGNYIFKSSFMRIKNVKINFYYEGIVMLDKNRMDRSFPRAIFQKKIVSLLILHRFIKYPDILPMDSPRIYRIYTPYVEKTPAAAEKKIEISFQKGNIKNAKGTLIVGVDAGENLQESYNQMIDFLRKEQQGGGGFLFKPHYADKSFVFEQEALKKAFDYTLIRDVRCLEEIISELNVNMVICTHLSSALLNLKMIYKDDLRVIFLAHPATIAALGAENISFAAELGVEVIVQNINAQ